MWRSRNRCGGPWRRRRRFGHERCSHTGDRLNGQSDERKWLRRQDLWWRRGNRRRARNGSWIRRGRRRRRRASANGRCVWWRRNGDRRVNDKRWGRHRRGPSRFSLRRGWGVFLARINTIFAFRCRKLALHFESEGATGGTPQYILSLALCTAKCRPTSYLVSENTRRRHVVPQSLFLSWRNAKRNA